MIRVFIQLNGTVLRIVFDFQIFCRISFFVFGFFLLLNLIKKLCLKQDVMSVKIKNVFKKNVPKNFFELMVKRLWFYKAKRNIANFNFYN